MIQLRASHVFMAAALGLLGSRGAAQSLEVEQVKAALDAFHMAEMSLDIGAMDAVWAHDQDAMLVNPRDRSVSIGWDSIKKNWESEFQFCSKLKITTRSQGAIKVNGSVAWSTSLVDVDGNSRAVNGQGRPPVLGIAPTFETAILTKEGDRWLLVSHSAWRVPY